MLEGALSRHGNPSVTRAEDWGLGMGPPHAILAQSNWLQLLVTSLDRVMLAPCRSFPIRRIWDLLRGSQGRPLRATAKQKVDYWVRHEVARKSEVTPPG
jgi:hypothetical protein